jgi:hypothetical protein
MTQQVDVIPGPHSICECAILSALDGVLRDCQAASSQLVVLSDEGMLCVVDTWPHDCLPESCHGHAWGDTELASFLEDFAEEGARHHVTADGRAVIPVLHGHLLWGAVIVDPGEAHPDAVAAAIAPQTSAIAESVRLRAH